MNWPMHPRVERRARRMLQMIERLDVDAGVLVRREHGDAYAKAHDRCLHCGTSDQCLRWLDGGNQTTAEPDFCPNLPLFRTCRRSTIAC